MGGLLRFGIGFRGRFLVVFFCFRFLFFLCFLLRFRFRFCFGFRALFLLRLTMTLFLIMIGLRRRPERDTVFADSGFGSGPEPIAFAEPTAFASLLARAFPSTSEFSEILTFAHKNNQINFSFSKLDTIINLQQIL